jgi:hypothetical protein
MTVQDHHHRQILEIGGLARCAMKPIPACEIRKAANIWLRVLGGVAGVAGGKAPWRVIFGEPSRYWPTEETTRVRT